MYRKAFVPRVVVNYLVGTYCHVMTYGYVMSLSLAIVVTLYIIEAVF